MLPFVNLDGDEDRDYFADGLSEDVTIALAGWRRFPLIAGSSTLTYRKAPLDPHRLGEELGARYLVAGSIRHQGKQVRINVRLIDTGDGRILWTRRYDVAPGDILAAQDESATRIAAAIQPELEHAELRRIDTKRSADLNAWDHFLRRVSFLYRFSAEDHEFARSHFERAIEIDPDYGDGGMRHTTPLSPPILMGADKLLVIETRSEGQDPEPELCVRYPSLGDIGSYLLDVIFMDHLHNDLTRLRQINHILEHLPESQAEQTGFRSIETLLIQPSRDLREIATRHMHRIPASVKALMRGVGAWGPGRLPSYLLFEVEFCRELIALGYRDGQAARERVQVFMTP